MIGLEHEIALILSETHNKEEAACKIAEFVRIRYSAVIRYVRSEAFKRGVDAGKILDQDYPKGSY